MRRLLCGLLLVGTACIEDAVPDGGSGGGGSTAGGAAAGGTTAGGSTAGGTTAGGSTAGGTTAGGTTAGGSTAGGSTAGGSTAGGSTAGGSTAGGTTAGGTTAGGTTAGGTTAGGSTAGGTTAGGSTAGGTTAGGSTAGGTTAGGTTAGGTPILIPQQAPYSTWTFIPIAGMTCAPGTPTGIGINPRQNSTRLAIFLRGGGICWDHQTCVATSGASFVQSGYGPTQFGPESTGQALNGGLFDRTNQQNPFRDFNFIYVPYCTGDLHTGRNVTSYLPDGGARVHHRGFENITAMLARVVPTFPTPTQLVVTGTSAGGFGAAWNFDQIASAWGPASPELVLIDDSGPFLTPPFFTTALHQLLAARFAWDTTNPACVNCRSDAGFFPVYRFNATRWPQMRGSLISSKGDFSISSRMAVSPGNPNLICFRDGGGPCEFFPGLNSLLDGTLLDAGYRAYVLNGTGHVWLDDPAGTITSGGVPLTTFLNQQLSNSPQWQTVRPP
jgi:hypothetical protein